MTQSAPGYQPYQQQPPVHQQAPPPPPRRARGGLNGLLAAVAALVAAGLTVGGLFGSITSYRSEESFEGESYVVGWMNSWWGFGDDGSTDALDTETVLNGLTLALAAVLLVAGAVFLLVSRNRGGGVPTVGRALTVAGAGVLTGAVLLELISSLAELSRHNEEELSAGETLEFSLGLGLFLPLGGVVVGIAAAVLAHLRQSPGRVEPVTPPMGFRQPYGTGPQQMQGYAQPHAPVPADERPTTVDTPGSSPAAGPEADVTQQVTVHENPAPGVAPQGSAQAGPAQAGQPGFAQPGPAAQAGAPQPGPGQPGTAGPPQQGLPQPGTAGAPQQGLTQPGTPQQGVAQPGAAGPPQPGVALPGSTAGGPQPFVPPAPMAPVGTPPQGAFAAPPQPPAPAQPATPVEQALSAPPAAPEVVAPPAPPATPAPPAQAEAPPAEAPAQAEAPATPSQGDERPAAESTEEPPAGPAISGLSGLPAAPPAPELSGEDDAKK